MTQYYDKIQGGLDLCYLKRSTCRDESKDFPEQYNQYSLLSLAKNDIKGTDIFLLYFPSLFKITSGLNTHTKINQLKGVKQDHFSYFFKVFIQIYTLKYIIFSQDQPRKEIIESVLDELVDQRTFVRNEPSFPSQVKIIITKIIQQHAQKQWIKRQNDFKNIQKIQNEIKEVLSRFNQKIDKEQQNLKQQQLFFDNWIDNNQDIKRSMANISKIKCLHFKSKKIIWYNFYQDNRYFMKMNISLIDEKRHHKNINTIIVKKYSKEKNHIYMKFYDYIKNIHEIQRTQKGRLKFKLKMDIENLLKISKQYYSKTNQYFPKLSINDIYVNQHTLQLFFSHHNLMLYYLGLDICVKTPELRITSQPTPRAIDDQISYFQIDPSNQTNIKKKYYFYDKHTKKKKEQQQCSMQNEKLFENIHVWRLLSIMRFMQVGSFMGEDYYKRKLCPDRGKSRQISKKRYNQQLKNLKEDLYTRKIQQQELLPMLKTFQDRNNQEKNSSQCKRKYFQFTFKELDELFDRKNNDDSLLSDNLLKIKMKFYHRAVILRQLNARFNERQLFKNIPNPLKYLFIYCMNAYQTATKQLQFLQKEKEIREKNSKQNNPNNNQKTQHIINYREALQIQFSKPIQDIILSKQFSSRQKINKTIIFKLQQYLQRDPSERNRKFLQNDKNEIHSRIKEIQQLNKDFTFLNKCKRILWQKDILGSRRLARIKQILRQKQYNRYPQKYFCIAKITRIHQNSQKVLDRILPGFGDEIWAKCKQLIKIIKKTITNCGVIKLMENFIDKKQNSYNQLQLDSLEKMYKSQRVGHITKLYFKFQEYDLVAQTILSSTMNQLNSIPQTNQEKIKWYNQTIQEYKNKKILYQQILRIPYNLEQSQGLELDSQNCKEYPFTQYHKSAQSAFFQTIEQFQQPEHYSQN